MTKQGFDFLDIARIKWKNRKLLLFIFFLSALICGLLSFLIPKEYKATAIILPARTTDLIVGDYGVQRGNIAQIGETEEAEQILEMLSSPSFLLDICEKLDLYTHYDLDRDKANSQTRILSKIKSNVSTKRTRFNAVYIEVMDRDPSMAQQLANRILDELDGFRNTMTAVRATQPLVYTTSKKDSLDQELQVLSRALEDLNKKGVVSKQERAGIYESLNPNSTSKVKNQIDSNLKYATEYDRLEKDHADVWARKSYIQRAIDQLEASSSGALPNKFEVQRALLPDKKAKPKRALVALLGAMGGTFLAVVFLIFMEYRSHLAILLEGEDQ